MLQEIVQQLRSKANKSKEKHLNWTLKVALRRSGVLLVCIILYLFVRCLHLLLYVHVRARAFLYLFLYLYVCVRVRPAA